VIRTILLALALVLIPALLIATGVHGLVTGEFISVTRRARITGLSARVLSSTGIIMSLTIVRAYWVIARQDGPLAEDAILRAGLILTAIAFAAALVILFLSVAF
jgi:hypothetical protein